MFNRSEKTCPSCEYGTGSRGKPVVRGDTTICLECGNSWKEFGNSTGVAAKTGVTDETLPVESHERNPLFGHQPIDRPVFEPDDAGYPVAAMAKIMPMMAATTGFMLFLVFLSWIGLNSLSNRSEIASLYTDTLSFEEIDRPSGGKIVKVHGRIANQDDERKVVHRVEIILRGQGGREISRWQHASKMTALQPGDTVRFVSAFPVSEAKIHSVEAHPL